MSDTNNNTEIIEQAESTVVPPNILDRIAKFIERFVFLQQKELYYLIATWVLSTHLIEHFEYTGYLFAHSPEPQSGKSRLLEVLDLLVCNSSGVEVSPTEAVLFRTAEGTTQLLDEADGWQNGEMLRSVLNAGWRRGGTVSRCASPEKGGDYQAKKWPVFGPRAIAGIGTRILSDTTKDRTFLIKMVRQTREERREKFRLRKLRPEVEALRKDIKEWAKQHGQEISECYDRLFPYLEAFRDRTIDVTEPLAAILEVAYKDNEERLEEIRVTLIEAIASTRKDQESLTADHRILEELVRLAQTEDPLVGSASELLSRCNGLPEEITAYDLARTIRHYGFENKNIRSKDGTVRHRYNLPLSQLNDLVARYVPKENKTYADLDVGNPLQHLLHAND